MHCYRLCCSHRVHHRAEVSNYLCTCNILCARSYPLSDFQLILFFFRLRTMAKNLLTAAQRRASIKETKYGVSTFENDLTEVNTCAKSEKFRLMAEFLEKLSFATLPIIFGIFNLIYWPWLLYNAEDYIKGKYLH